MTFWSIIYKTFFHAVTPTLKQAHTHRLISIIGENAYQANVRSQTGFLNSVCLSRLCNKKIQMEQKRKFKSLQTLNCHKIYYINELQHEFVEILSSSSSSSGFFYLDIRSKNFVAHILVICTYILVKSTIFHSTHHLSGLKLSFQCEKPKIPFGVWKI